MNKLIKQAKKLHQLGLMPIPVNAVTKLQLITDQLGNKYEYGRYTGGFIADLDFGIFKNATGVAIATGLASGGLEALDMEGKFDVSGRLMENFKQNVIARLGFEFFNSLVIQTTQHLGWHVLYKSELAKEYKSRVLALNRNRKCLIETRSNLNYIIVEPSEGYRLLQGTYDVIPSITPSEHQELHRIAKQLNELRGFDANLYEKRKNAIRI